ncbi:putative phage tail assembly chaperone [Vibrio sp.]|nr:putative phage tail assembly chaperone [Vibrio sp.]
MTKAAFTSKPVVVSIGETDFSFTPTVNDYNNYTNDLMPDNKIEPARTYLIRTVEPEQKQALNELMNTVPGLIMDVFGEVTKASKGGIKVTLKN